MRRRATVLVALALFPSAAIANCGNEQTCHVGASGQGGGSSGGKAHGFYYEEPSHMFPGQTLTNAGNSLSGRLTVGGGSTVTESGTAHGDTFRGHGTGVFGDWAGQCDLDDFPTECEDLP